MQAGQTRGVEPKPEVAAGQPEGEQLKSAVECN
jgi:hypothetical protein